MKKILISSALIMGCTTVFAQETAEKLTVKVGGYIRTEAFYDSYRSSESRDGETYSYPLRRGLDALGRDTNRVNQFELLGLQSRFRVGASGLTVFGAKLSGVIEADFNGSAEDYKYNVVFRHAFMRFDWSRSQLLLGQYWSPMTIAEFAANTVLFASGTTFQPVARATQVRYTYNFNPGLRLSGAAVAYSTHRVVEPKGFNSQRLSGLPDLSAQLQYGNVNKLFLAYTIGYRSLRPYLAYKGLDGKRYKTRNNVESYYMQACAGYQFPMLSVKVQGNLGQNMTNYGMIGGYGQVKGSANELGEPEYSNITVMSLWTDFETKGQRVKFGLFAGYSENLGSSDSIVNDNLMRDPDIKKLLRISPRMYIINGPIDIGIEYIMNAAVYGKFEHTKVVRTEKRTINNRVLVAVRYTF